MSVVSGCDVCDQWMGLVSPPRVCGDGPRLTLRCCCSTVLFQEVSAVVETDDGGRFPIRLLDCDTITQAKEKIMDVAFRSVKASQRHNLSEVDIEYRFESTTLILRDEDRSSVTEGPWRRINTLKHYKVS